MNIKSLFVGIGVGVALCLSVDSSSATIQDAVTVYPSIANGSTAAIEGRVVERKSNGTATQSDRKRDTLRRNLALMINNERKHYPVTVLMGAREWQTQTDQEGYFRVDVDGLSALPTGWHDIAARTEHGSGASSLLIVPANNTHGLISDIDDTIQVTEVTSKRRMLANTFLRNARQREAVPGIAAFYRQLIDANDQPAAAPLFYLSASPKQLHTVIEEFLAHNRFPRGVLMTKRVTDDSTSEPISNQAAYKTAKIEAILTALPQVRFTLVGDDGERDPEIYADIQQRFPDRIAAVWIRQVNPDPKRTRIEGQGVLDDALRRFVEAR